jgi:hypothetical protein
VLDNVHAGVVCVHEVDETAVVYLGIARIAYTETSSKSAVNLGLLTYVPTLAVILVFVRFHCPLRISSKLKAFADFRKST